MQPDTSIREWLEDGSWRSNGVKAAEAIAGGRGDVASAIWRLICDHTADYLRREREQREVPQLVFTLEQVRAMGEDLHEIVRRERDELLSPPADSTTSDAVAKLYAMDLALVKWEKVIA